MSAQSAAGQCEDGGGELQTGPIVSMIMAKFLWIFSALIFLTIPVSSQLNQLFFPGFKAAATNITLNGNANIQKIRILELTNETSRLMGHAFYASPFQFKNSIDGKAFSFSTSFAFALVPEYPKLGGHG
jgi:hypothetical protein